MKWLAAFLFALYTTTSADEEFIKYDLVAVKRFDDELRRLGIVLPSVTHLEEPVQHSAPFASAPAGDFEGYWTKSQFGRPVAVFDGIPYAQPPVGPLRLKVSQPLTSRLKNFKANETRSACPQGDLFGKPGVMVGSEDCLYLNVYVPEKIQRREDERLPVVIYIHGGVFMSGSKDFYRGNVLMDKDVLFVNMNYRLGPLGFLTTGDDVIPGNLGLKDQLAALHWVRENIAAFGGNPNLITISGHSSGAASAEFLSISPLAKGLIQRVFAISGSSMAGWVLAPPGETEENTRKLAEHLGCPSKPSSAFLSCLQTKTAKEITLLDSVFSGFPAGIRVPFKPVIEGDVPGALLPHHPKKLFAESPNDVPYMTGITSDEGMLWALGLFGDASLLKELDTRFNEVVPSFLYLTDSQHTNRTNLEMLRRVYFGESGPFKKSQLFQGSNLFTDNYFLVPLMETLQYRRKGAKSPAYVWYFSYEGSRNLPKLLGFPESHGVCHGDDLFFILTLVGDMKPSAEDVYLSMVLTDLVSSFARDGVPSSKILKNEWKPVTSPGTDIDYLHIKSPLIVEMEKDLLPERWTLMQTLMVDRS